MRDPRDTFDCRITALALIDLGNISCDHVSVSMPCVMSISKLESVGPLAIDAATKSASHATRPMRPTAKRARGLAASSARAPGSPTASCPCTNRAGAGTLVSAAPTVTQKQFASRIRFQ